MKDPYGARGLREKLAAQLGVGVAGGALVGALVGGLVGALVGLVARHCSQAVLITVAVGM